MNDSRTWLLKLMILIFVFPTISALASGLAALVLGWLPGWLPESSQDEGTFIIMGIVTVLGFLGGFFVSRAIWPKQRAEPMSLE